MIINNTMTERESWQMPGQGRAGQVLTKTEQGYNNNSNRTFHIVLLEPQDWPMSITDSALCVRFRDKLTGLRLYTHIKLRILLWTTTHATQQEAYRSETQHARTHIHKTTTGLPRPDATHRKRHRASVAAKRTGASGHECYSVSSHVFDHLVSWLYFHNLYP